MIETTKLDLTNVSLVAVSTDRAAETVRAMKHCLARARFKNAYLFTNRALESPAEIELVPIPNLQSVAEYCHFLIRYLPAYSELFAGHILVIQWDGYIVDSGAWTPEFLEYDYIGARWDDGVVGNGGFSLRSARLMRALLDLRAELTRTHPEDEVIGRTYRERLEQIGVCFPPNGVADRFSVEDRAYEGSLGFHGWRCRELSDRSALRCDVDVQDLYNCAMLGSSDVSEHVATLYRLARECRHITEFCHRNIESTAAFLHARPRRLCSYNVLREPMHEDLVVVAAGSACDIHYQCADTRTVCIEPTDMLYIDSTHTYSCVRQELELSADKVKRYIVFHDTTTFGDRGSEGDEVGIWPAIEEFLSGNPEWAIREKYENNNGLTLLVRLE